MSELRFIRLTESQDFSKSKSKNLINLLNPSSGKKILLLDTYYLILIR